MPRRPSPGLAVSALLLTVAGCGPTPPGAGGEIIVSDARGTQEKPSVLSDGEGGAYVALLDYRSFWANIYIQRLGSQRKALWAPGGVALTNSETSQSAPRLLADGNGGVIVAWRGEGPYGEGATNVYMQRVDHEGQALWAPGGVALALPLEDRHGPSLVSDKEGGAIVVWTDFRAGDPDIYAQRVASSGDVLWAHGGVMVVGEASEQTLPCVVADGEGGAIIAWTDLRNGDSDIYAQRVDEFGVPQWSPDGVAVAAFSREQSYARITSDHRGGAIVVWKDWSDRSLTDLYAQRLSEAGELQWPTSIPIVTAGRYPESPAMVADGVGGAIVAWSDYREGVGLTVFCQRLDGEGNVLWDSDGIAATTVTSGLSQRYPRLVASGPGAAILTWEQCCGDTDYDVYAQKLDAEGVRQWKPEGVAVSAVEEAQVDPDIAVDGAGGAIIVWTDTRQHETIEGKNVYARFVSAAGEL